MTSDGCSKRVQNLVRGICHALYLGLTPADKLDGGELGYFSNWLVSPLSRNTYVDLIDAEVAAHNRRNRVAISLSCTEVLNDPISPCIATPPQSLSVSSSAVLMAPPPPKLPASILKKSSAAATATTEQSTVAPATTAVRSVIPSLSKRTNQVAKFDSGISDGANDLNISEQRFAEIMENATKKRRRHEIGVVSTSEFAATLEANRLNAEKASLQSNVITTTAVKQESLSGNDMRMRSSTDAVMLKASTGSDASGTGNADDDVVFVTERHQITTNSVASESVAKTSTVMQFLQTTINEQFETTSVIGALAQLFLVVSLEPVDFSITLSFARRRSTELITNNLLDIYNTVSSGTNNTNSNNDEQQPAVDDAQILNTANDRLSINFFSRFPELSIECKSLSVTVCQSIFSLAAFATQIFERAGCTLSPQAENLQRFKFNNIMDDELGDRSRLLKGLCHSAIVQIGGEHKTRLVTEMFTNALFCTSERVHALICRGKFNGLPDGNALLQRLSRAEKMLTSLAHEIINFFLLKK